MDESLSLHVERDEQTVFAQIDVRDMWHRRGDIERRAPVVIRFHDFPSPGTGPVLSLDRPCSSRLRRRAPARGGCLEGA